MTTAAEPGFTLDAMLRRLAAERPDSPAVTLGERTVSFAELHARSSQMARLLQQRGVRRGDRVAVLDKNAPTFYDVVFGAAKLGAVTVGLNYRLAPAELAGIVADASPVLVLAGVECAHLLPADVPVVLFDDAFEKLLAGVDDTDVDTGTAPGDVALQLYSSGTTGQPKGAMLTHANLSWTPRMGREFYGMGPATVNLVPSPLFHIGGVGYSLTAMGQGAHTVLVRDVSPAHLLELIARHRVTHSFMVPSVIQMVIEHPDVATTDLTRLSRIAYGGAPMSSDLLLRAMAALGCAFMSVYGMTETAGTVVSMAPDDHDPGGPRAGLLKSVGVGLPWLEVRIVDPLGTDECAVGEVGEICVRSPQNMIGYWGRPEQTAATLVDGGWLRTGDAAYRDADGFVFMHDRIKDMIVSGGENIYPAEVEQVMGAHPLVAEVAVIGVPSARWGETPRAVVVPRPGAVLDPAELIAWTRDRLAHYKCPSGVDLVDALPRNASGKVVKHRLRAVYGESLRAQPV